MKRTDVCGPIIKIHLTDLAWVMSHWWTLGYLTAVLEDLETSNDPIPKPFKDDPGQEEFMVNIFKIIERARVRKDGTIPAKDLA